MRLYEQLPASERHEPGCRFTVIDRQSLGDGERLVAHILRAVGY